WWGAGRCTIEQYNQIWQFTQVFLRDSLNVHNLIYAISPSDFYDREAYLRIYPGDAYVDIFGMDFYFTSQGSPGHFAQRIRIPAQLGLERGKVAAVTEVGQENLPTANWFTANLLPPFKADSLTSRVVYAAVWRNAHTGHFFAPYPGHATVPDFIKFYQDPYTLFEQDLPDMFGPEQADMEAPRFLVYPAAMDTITFTTFTIRIVTNERASLRYSAQEQDYIAMPFEFDEGQGSHEHRTTLTGAQGHTYTYFVRAVDLAGNVTEPLRFTFYVDTLKREIHWNDIVYRSDDWKSGAAPLGFGDPCNITGTDTAKTVYFRKAFSLNEIPAALGFLVQCHDGAVAYVNGLEIGRVNITTGLDMDYDSHALSACKSSKIFVFSQEALESLRIGENMMAVEVHTADVPSTDVSFDGRVFNQYQFFIDLGEDWDYYDAGHEPKRQILGDILTGVPAGAQSLPKQVRLMQNQPNPFNAFTRIHYELPAADRVRLDIFDITGRRVAMIFDGMQKAGEHTVTFDARDLPSAVYFYRLQTGTFSAVKRMIVLK
ncbi:T9SS type A sorting domain-containing protein, partial [candidate division KSB1 bacterium]|nr:T9SS type A sorting domain-containing protein [candidate division KSB1 bacterium]